jgi:hypothetical protein
MSNKYPVTVEPRDIEAAVKKQMAECTGIRKISGRRRHGEPARINDSNEEEHIKACMQGALDFGWVAHRKFEGFISSLEERNAVYFRLQRLCSKRFGPWGSSLTDACDRGAYGVGEIVDKIGNGLLRRSDKLSGKRRR